MIYDVFIGDKSHRVELDRNNASWSCRCDGRFIEIDAMPIAPNLLSLGIGDKSYEVRREQLPEGSKIWVGHEGLEVKVRDPRSLRGRVRAADERGVKKLVAPMPGKVVRIMIQEGAQVQAGDGVMVVEAMKMQNEVKSPKKGKLKKILVSPGAAVNVGDVLAIVE
ncbi:MAG TPA: biotin/lipoyl-containing protein [Candidatus Sulfotelmatobacter sp.]